MKQDIKSALYDSLKKYGEKENICFSTDLKNDWERFASYDSVKASFPSDIDLRHKLISQGRILEENLDKHFYCWLIQLEGLFAPEVLVVTIMEDDHVQIGAFAKEGLLSKGTAGKAVKQVKKALTK